MPDVPALSDEAREDLAASLAAKSDSELAYVLLGIHRATKAHAYADGSRKGQKCAEVEAVVITVALTRWAPVAFADGLALWTEYQEDEDDA